LNILFLIERYINLQNRGEIAGEGDSLQRCK